MTYAQAFEDWNAKFRTTAKGFGFEEQELDDVIQDLFLALQKGNRDGRGYLDIFDSSKGAFTTFMYTFARNRLLGYRRTKMTRQRKELPLPLQIDLGDGESCSNPQEDLFSERAFADVESRLNVAITVELLTRQGHVESAQLLQDMYNQVVTEGSVNRQELADARGISLSAISTRIKALRKYQPVMAWHSPV